MKKIVFILTCYMFSFASIAGQTVDKTLDADPQGFVEIKNVSGVIEVKSWDKDQVHVQGKLDKLAEDFIFERDGNQILIQVKLPNFSGRKNYRKEDGDDLVIYVPSQSHVTYSSINADYVGAGYTGGTDVSLVNGDIELQDLTGRIKANTVNGDIKGKDLKGDIGLSTVNGDVKEFGSTGSRLVLQAVNGDLHANSDIEDVYLENVNGEINGEFAQIKNIAIRNVNGSTHIVTQLMENGELEASTVSGRIHLGFTETVSARVNIEAHSGGKIVNSLTDDSVQSAKYGPRRWLQFVSGDGAGRINVSTVSGRITLAKH